MPRARTSRTRLALCLGAAFALVAALLASASSSTALATSDAVARGFCCSTGPDKLANAAKPTIDAANKGKLAPSSTAKPSESKKLVAKRNAGAFLGKPKCDYSGANVICRSAMNNRTSGRSMGTARLVVTGDGYGRVTNVSFY